MAVFEDLWAKGLCVAGGSNYGTDYVVYDGKPFVLFLRCRTNISHGEIGLIASSAQIDV